MHKFKARSPCGLKKCWSTTCKYSKNFFFRKNCLFVEDYQLSIAYSSYMTFNLHFNLYHQSFLSHPPFPYSAIAIGDHFPFLLSFALATPPPPSIPFIPTIEIIFVLFDCSYLPWIDMRLTQRTPNQETSSSIPFRNLKTLLILIFIFTT